MSHVAFAAARCTVDDVLITEELKRRSTPQPDYFKENLAFQDLAQHMAEQPSEVLPRLVRLALEICGADSAGISVLEGEVFRWLGLHGKLSVFEGATTPRNFSPCGVCLDQSRPILMERPERVYDWIADAKITVPEVLLVPLLIKGEAPIGTLWIVAKEGQRFNAEHARMMSELAVFTGIALKMIQSEQQLRAGLAEQKTLAREMSHRVKNIFAVTEALIRRTARHAATKQEMTESLLSRLHALASAHGLINKAVHPNTQSVAVEIGDIVDAVLRPHRLSVSEGPHVQLGERATSNMALVLHELATNATKYGALSSGEGSIRLLWQMRDGSLDLSWKEQAGPPVTAPEKRGFGSELVEKAIASLGGTIVLDWASDGLAVEIKVPEDRLEG